MPQLTELKLRAIKPTGEVKRYHDAKGLYLEVSRAGSKLWRWKYSFGGKEKRLSVGIWPEVTLREAREKCEAFRRELKSGEDPSPKVKKEKKNAMPTFHEVAEAWRSNMTNVWAESHAVTVKGRLNLDVYPAFGDSPIASLQPLDVLGMLRKI
jgi:hypothetical protein